MVGDLWGRGIAQQNGTRNWGVILRDGRGIKDGLGLDPLSTFQFLNSGKEERSV